MSISVISSFASEAPFGGTWESPFTGFVSTNSGAPIGLLGTASNIALNGSNLLCAGVVSFEGAPYLMISFDTAATSQNFFTAVQVQKLPGGPIQTYYTTQAIYYPAGTNNQTFFGGGIGDSTPTTGPFWNWPDSSAEFHTGGVTTLLTFSTPPPAAPTGNGDITNPEAWQDAAGNIPPLEFDLVPEDTNFPQNGDGRYWFNINANTVDSGSPIKFIGNPAFYTGFASLQWSVTSTANDGSGAQINYSLDGVTWTTTTILPQTQINGIQNGDITFSLATATAFKVQVFPVGGTPTAGASVTQVALAITRNVNEGLQWDSPNPFNPMGYNAQCMDNAVDRKSVV